jgi:hypothetical protein
MSTNLKPIKSSFLSQSNQWDRLLRPSWLSLLVVLVVGLLIVGGTIVTLNYKKSGVPLLVQLQEKPPTVHDSYEVLDESFSANTLLSNLPLFIFWAAVGMIVYSFTTSSIKAMDRARDFREEMGYMHANRHRLLRTAGLRLAIRLAVLLVWLLFISYSRNVLLPYVVAVAYASTGPVSVVACIGYIVWATFLAAFCLHLHTVLLRLLALRPRLFEVV